MRAVECIPKSISDYWNCHIVDGTCAAAISALFDSRQHTGCHQYIFIVLHLSPQYSDQLFPVWIQVVHPVCEPASRCYQQDIDIEKAFEKHDRIVRTPPGELK